MASQPTRPLPLGLAKTRGRFDQWRRTRKGRSPIPERLWNSAVKAAAKYGLSKTAQALGVDYYGLKKRIEDASSRCRSEQEAVATFLEVAAPAPSGLRQCTVELEDPDGSKMRIDVRSEELPDLTALSQSFWIGRS